MIIFFVSFFCASFGLIAFDFLHCFIDDVDLFVLVWFVSISSNLGSLDISFIFVSFYWLRFNVVFSSERSLVSSTSFRISLSFSSSSMMGILHSIG
jgi:hypothetical protein